jgi:hypothetical protein
VARDRERSPRSPPCFANRPRLAGRDNVAFPRLCAAVRCLPCLFSPRPQLATKSRLT